MNTSAAHVFADVADELARAETKFPDQHLPDGTGTKYDALSATAARRACQAAAEDGTVTWRDVIAEEVFEAFAETDPALLRAELVQVAAMAIRWIRDIDLREVAA